MIKAILLDLDDTLLRIDTDTFVRDYLAALSAFITRQRPEVPADTFQRAISRAARTTMQNTDPARVNNAIIVEVISTATGLSGSELGALFTQFYDVDYSALGANAVPAEGAAILVDRLLSAGYSVVIATMPIYPRRAILERLRWAGFDAERLPFKLITTLENMHFSKPSPHYYEEILARIGIEADDALMVGDSVENDLIPASNVGMATFWANWNSQQPPQSFMPDGAGSLLELNRCIGEGWLQSLLPRPRTVAQVVPRMMGNIAALRGLVSEMAPQSWTTRSSPDDWSPLEIVCHLRDSEGAVQRAQLLTILEENNPFLAPAPIPPGPGERNLSGLDGLTVLEQFADERATTLQFLSSLNDNDWLRPARHSIFGPTTLLELAHFTARHDRLHINQLTEILAPNHTN